MESNEKRNKTIDGIETAILLVGVTLGVVPLIQALLGKEQGFSFDLILGKIEMGPAWLLPVVVLAVGGLAIAVAEKAKRD